MAVEVFEDNLDPLTSLHIVVYKAGRALIPSWWLELPGDDDDDLYDLNEIQAVLNCLPSIKVQLEAILGHFE